ncbi:unnamed protein product [Echinostoma caproni]|uniref:Mediator of RNA polymerase II transcription subunit 13 n=1 Tax=Echinostoma caproni TaxID=27848 RepID=A0A183A2W4_9TREM|nr:unnamed protein product [Echinostoma caproni]
MFGPNMKCPLLAVVSRISRIGDLFQSMESSMAEPGITWDPNEINSSDRVTDNPTLQYVRLLHEVFDHVNTF